MRFSITGWVRVTADYQKGATASQHVATDFCVDTSDNLAQEAYNDEEGFPSAIGSHALTNVFIQGLIGNIHHAHQQGYKDSAEHLRYIIAELERGFVQVAKVTKGKMGDDINEL